MDGPPGGYIDIELERKHLEHDLYVNRCKLQASSSHGPAPSSFPSEMAKSSLRHPHKKRPDILKDSYQFVRNEEEDSNVDSPWEDQIAKKYYDKLYKEYALADMSRYREGKLGLRWRVEKEVIYGKGETLCGNKECNEREGLCSYEVPFHYTESGQSKMTLVKLRVCASCAEKLQYKHRKNKTLIDPSGESKN